MSLFPGIDISASGLRAEAMRMNVIANNIANVETTNGSADPYQRHEVVLIAAPLRTGFAAGPPNPPGGVRVLAVRPDNAPTKIVYRPDHPAANEHGYVQLPNVDLPLEMVDLLSARRAYEANAATLRTAREMANRTLDILR